MKIDPRLLAVVFVAALSACKPSETESGGATPPATTPTETPETCGDTRWIGTAPTCTPPSGWTATPLFGVSAPPPLDTYCVYEWPTANGPSQNEVSALLGSGPQGLARDCPAVVAQGMSYEPSLALSLRESLEAHVGTVTSLRVPPVKGPPVRVTVVDTAPDALLGGSIPVGNDRHGDTLASLIRDIGCGSEGCGAEPASALGLPWLDPTDAPPGGGHVGRLSDVALGVLRAFDASESDPARPHLVINLSVGWENVPGVSDCGGDPAAMQAPAHAVYDVLQRAACGGALVVAAAGNDAGGPTPPTGLICPARWEALPIDACPAHVGEPLLHAVGGVDYADEPIVATRPLGRPRLAATALGGVSWASGDPIPPVLTGTSVAAAVASAVSAVVWSRDPTLSGAEVMELVYASGLPLGTADTCPWGTASCEIRRISLCTALHAAGLPGLSCTAVPALDYGTPPLPTVVLEAIDAAFDATIPSPTNAVPVVALSDLPRYAVGSPALWGGGFPQPGVPTCPSCAYTRSMARHRHTFNANVMTPLYNPSLVIQPVGGGALMSAPLTASLALGPARFMVTGVTSVSHAYLTGYTEPSNTVSVTQEILVTQ